MLGRERESFPCGQTPSFQRYGCLGLVVSRCSMDALDGQQQLLSPRLKSGLWGRPCGSLPSCLLDPSRCFLQLLLPTRTIFRSGKGRSLWELSGANSPFNVHKNDWEPVKCRFPGPRASFRGLG